MYYAGATGVAQSLYRTCRVISVCVLDLSYLMYLVIYFSHPPSLCCDYVYVLNGVNILMNVLLVNYVSLYTSVGFHESYGNKNVHSVLKCRFVGF